METGLKQKDRKSFVYSILLVLLAGVLCACKGQSALPEITPGVPTEAESPEQAGPATPESGMPTEAPEPIVTLPTEVPEPTATNIPTDTPTPVITDPYDGRFWIGKYSEDTTVLLTKGQIKEQNDKNCRAAGTKLTELSEQVSYTAGEVLAMIEEYGIPSRKYFDNREFGASKREELLQARNLPALKADIAREITPEYGILVSNTDVRSFPTEKRLTSEVQGRFDYLQETRLLIGEPVLVLHHSADGVWRFVQAENYSGWIKDESIAYCSEAQLQEVAEELADVENDKKLVVVTRNGKYRIGEREVYLRMGTRLLCDDSMTVKQPYGDADMTVKLPCRDADGMLVWEAADVNAVDEAGEVCFVNGYLAFTRANLMMLAVRLLDSPYAWGDALSFGADPAEAGDNGMDCSSTVLSVFRCFGLSLPRNTGTQRKMDCEKIIMSDMRLQQRKDLLDSLQGGELLYTSGHVMLYLGKVDGAYFILHNTSTEARDDGGTDAFYRCVITTTGLGKTGQTILERLIQMNTLISID